MRVSTITRRFPAVATAIALGVASLATPVTAAPVATGTQQLTAAAANTAPTTRQIVGAVAVGDRYPYVFVIGTDGNLWINWQDQSEQWNWSNMGTPPGVALRMPIGVTIVDGFSRPYAFVLGSDQNVWSLWRSATSWQWRNQGAPPGANFVSWPSFAAVAVNDTSPYLFVRSDGDETVWVNWWNGSVWNWTNISSPPDGIAATGPVGVLLENGTPQVYTVGNGGRLWTTRFDDTAAPWVDLGQPPGVWLTDAGTPFGARSAVQVAPDARPYLLATGSDDNAWLRWWTGTQWEWHNLGSPPEQLVPGTLGALAVNGTSPFSFFATDGGGLWINYWDGSNWHWSDQSPPFRPALTGTAVLAPQNSTRPAIFLRDTAGNLWSRWWNGSYWSWTNRSL
ncbi:hypothetical protein [Micromonospora sp. NPDC003816]|uniref:hypothetical protein n=1 Tax=Micromonospora sp. NPDC003816 TaxID=3364224 RepID=UPI0036CBD445